jgi:23S rRNA (guanine2445-N2)-methyltransferase / 23S rRNA (guanine2069-N7)-methyltransferase
MPLASFEATDPDELYEGIHQVDWSSHLDPNRTLAVGVAGRRSPIGPSHFIALRAKDAIVDRIREARGVRPDVDKKNPDLRVHVHAGTENTTVSLDLSGRGLHHRGRARSGASAPLRENLAAALLHIAGWPEQATDRPLLDPMCGSATILTEAAGMALDLAPGLERGRLGAEGWLGHDAALWARLRAEAIERRSRSRSARLRIAGFDLSPDAARVARDHVAHAGLERWIRIEVRELSEARPPWKSPGLLITNPPYGERLGEVGELEPLYEMLGDVLKRRFPGWSAWVLGGNRTLEKRIGLRPAARHVLFNGPIECRFLSIPVSEDPPSGRRGPGWRRSADEAKGFARRLKANEKHLRRWAEGQQVSCYRVYDSDVPQYNIAVDRYGRWVRVEEYRRPSKVREADAARRRRDALLVVSEVLGVDRADIVLCSDRQALRRRGVAPRVDRERPVTVSEAGLRFRLSLGEAPRAGLPLDERLLRDWIRQRAAGRDLVHLFAGSCSAAIAAAAGGARSTTSVDPSRSSIDRGRHNLSLNGLGGASHRFLPCQVDTFVRDSAARRRFGLLLLSPPRDERDPGALLVHAADLIEPGGELLLATRDRRFEPELGRVRGLAVDEITRELTPRDFAGKPRLRIWRGTFSVGR